MAECKHTPGPWKLLSVEGKLCPADRDNQSILTIVDEGGTLFAAVYEEADARLIAASPELLDVVKIFVSAEEKARDGECVQGADRLIFMGRAAIAKAEGRSHD